MRMSKVVLRGTSAEKRWEVGQNLPSEDSDDRSEKKNEFLVGWSTGPITT